MGQYVGLDVSLETTKVHVLDEQGKRVWRGTCVTHPTAIEATIRKHAPYDTIMMRPNDCATACARSDSPTCTILHSPK